MAENGSLLGKVEKILRAQAGREVEQDNERFVVTTERVSRGKYRATAWIFNAADADKRTLSDVIVANIEGVETKPTFDEFEVALFGAAMAEVKRRRAALDAAVGE